MVYIEFLEIFHLILLITIELSRFKNVKDRVKKVNEIINNLKRNII